MSTEVSSDLVLRLAGQVARGECILFTGAGFSFGATASDGEPIPGVGELAKLLWPIGFPGQPYDDLSTLADIYECALQSSEKRTAELMRDALTVDATGIPKHFQTWFSVPWKRVYTLNIDNLDEAVQRAHHIPAPIVSISALSDPKHSTSGNTESIHLNGTVADIPHVTFSARQYGERLTGGDPFYPALVRDIMGSPVVFVGTSLDESPLWQHLAYRGNRKDLDKELRPRSYLVAPSLAPARERILQNLNIELVAMTAEEFASEVLTEMRTEIDAGHKIHELRRQKNGGQPALTRVSELRNRKQDQVAADFLLGREPTWADITSGYAVTRTFEADLLADPGLLGPRVVLITGTAGSGKSTTLRRLALELQASGADVWFLDSETSLSIPELRRMLSQNEPEVVAIDDVDFLGSHAAPFIDEVIRESESLRLLISSGSSRAEKFGIAAAAKKIDSKLVTVPHLDDSDVDLLLDALDRANRLGILKGMSAADRRHAVLVQCIRYLLVAMIQATSGRNFDDKIDDECRDLPNNQALIYLIVALATRFRSRLSTEEVLLAAGIPPVAALEALDGLRRQHLVLTNDNGLLTIRHRVIAERVVAYYRKEHRLTDAVEGLSFSLATKAGTHVRHSRESKLLGQLLNHDFLIREIGHATQARKIYNAVENLLTDDSHYWLQRGSLEVEKGNLEYAENFLNQALTLAPNDTHVQSEWAYMSLKRASEDAGAGRPGWSERAEDALKELRDAIDRRGRTDSYPYHILGSQVLRFSRAAPLTPTQRERLLFEARAVVREGCKLHPSQRV